MIIENRGRKFKVIGYDYDQEIKRAWDWSEALTITKVRVLFKGFYRDVNLSNLSKSRLDELEKAALEIHKASLEPDHDSMREGK